MEKSPSSKIPDEWSKVPKVSTRTELMELRKKENLPDISYDLDGDGVVSGKDYYLGKRFDQDRDGKLNSRERANALAALQAGLDDSLVWGCDSSGINRSFRIVQKRGNVILNEEFGGLKSTYPTFPITDNTKVKSKSELEALRKEEVKLQGKYYEKKITKEYRIEMTDNNTRSESPAASGKFHEYDQTAQFCEFDYKEQPNFRTKHEMLESKKKKLLDELNTSCNFQYKTQYERLLSREKQIGVSPGRIVKPLHEKIKEENMQHFSEMYSKRPIGVHGKELPKFSENLKEYWKVVTPTRSSQNSWKKLTIMKKNDFANYSRAEIAEKDDVKETKMPVLAKKGQVEGYLKPNQVEHSEVSASKEFNRNSRWTNYHYVFMQKGANETEKIVSTSITPDVKKQVKAFKTPKSLIVQRMLRRGNFSPGKDIFRSTGFA